VQRVNALDQQKQLIEHKRARLKSRKSNTGGADQSGTEAGVQPCANMDEILKVRSALPCALGACCKQHVVCSGNAMKSMWLFTAE
jgi:hypothetical protein